VVPQLKQNLFHLECSREGFNEHRRTDRVMRHANIRLREEKDIIPETRFKIVFHFWEVEVWAYTPLHKFIRIMVEIKCEVKQGTRHRLVVHRYAELIQMPSPRAKYISISYVERKKRQHTERLGQLVSQQAYTSFHPFQNQFLS